MQTSLRARLLADGLGTLRLLAVVIGSGIMAECFSGCNSAVALLGNTLATVFGLYVLIEIFGPLSRAHFNPAVSLVMAIRKELLVRLLPPYVLAQLLGAWLAEAVATAGLLLVILQQACRQDLRHGRGIHRGGLLVHRLHILHQSRRRVRPHAER